MANTLLDKAKKAKNRKKILIDSDVLELALAWANDEITVSQASTAIGLKPASVYIILARSLKKIIQNQK